jgi:hypothetical protein
MSWLSGWKYRKKLTIANSGAALTDYQLKFTINRSSGSDSGYTVYTVSKCLENYNDIRFTKSDGTTLLDYWIESATAASAVIWVKVDTLAASGTTDIYIHYGNSSASAVSSGANTFIFFDNFDDGDTTDWTKTGNIVSFNADNTQYVSPSYSAKFIAGSDRVTYGYAYKTISELTSLIYEVRARPAQTNKNCYPTIYKGATDNGAHFFFGLDGNINYYDGSQHVAMASYSANTWYRVKLVIKSTTKYDIYIDDVLKVSDVNINGVVSGFDNVQFKSYSSGVFYVDNSRIRKYAATEPTITAWGSEEKPITTVVPIWTALAFTDATIIPDHTTIEASYTYPNDYILIEWS